MSEEIKYTESDLKTAYEAGAANSEDAYNTGYDAMMTFGEWFRWHSKFRRRNIS